MNSVISFAIHGYFALMVVRYYRILLDAIRSLNLELKSQVYFVPFSFPQVFYFAVYSKTQKLRVSKN
jgi:hypothetical protein